MKKTCTHMTVILDRTGSMDSIRDDTIGGYNAFLDTQRKAAAKAGAKATITLVQFDSQDPFEVIYSCKDVSEAPDLSRDTYVPRACTPLFDAMGRGMLDLDKALESAAGHTRPDTVLFVVITDGLENASREFSRADILRMVEERKARDWQFVFLSADMDAVDEAHDLGVSAAASMRYARTSRGVGLMYAALAERVAMQIDSPCEKLEFSRDDRAAQDEESAKE